MQLPAKVLVLGCGYTARRVAQDLIRLGISVVCTNRNSFPLAGADCIDLDAANPESLLRLTGHLSQGMTVLHSIPPAGQAENFAEYTPDLLEVLIPFNPSRLVYISSTGVYGSAVLVDETTPVLPVAARDKLRTKAEHLIASGAWRTLILRPAAIYGPGRGVHFSVQQGVFQLPPDGQRVISRIHVDDLAKHTLAGFMSDVTGAYPVADEEPCPSLDVARLAARLLGLPTPVPDARSEAVPGRRVDGSACRRALGIALQYPSYRQGVPACLASKS